jgi:hypothetical protein
LPQLNSIGPYVFLDLKGNIDPLKQEVELLKRPGVAGVGLKLTGVRGRPFTLHSVCDALDRDDAQETYINYTNLIADGPQNLVQYDFDFSTYGVGFLVLDVKQIRRAQMLFVTGGLFPPSRGWVEADWTLVCVALAEEGGDE